MSSSFTTFKRSLNENDDAFSLEEVIQSELENKEIANAVLGASDHTNCSYDTGYVYRQALYSCLTCKKLNNQSTKPSLTIEDDDDDDEMHGICLACSYECHESHQLVELYTKRSFRCDCGNEKFNRNSNNNKFKCKLQPNKEKLNQLNKYNHNFVGLYCTCNKPYPPLSPPESQENEENEENEEEDDDDDEEMFQCVICEDWFHSNHLNGIDFYDMESGGNDDDGNDGNDGNDDDDDDDDELICHQCMRMHQFLWNYTKFIPYKNLNLELNQQQQQNTDKTTTNCKLNQLNYKESMNCCVFKIGWRDALCKCEECLKLYKHNGIEFLLNKNDTIKHYEENGIRLYLFFIFKIVI
jgi:E3 ubiquitin-protein ligase UBR7